MDFALFALLRSKSPNFQTLRKDLSFLKLPNANREDPVLETLDAQGLSTYIKAKAAVQKEWHVGIQRSPSEASLFFHCASPKEIQRLTTTTAAAGAAPSCCSRPSRAASQRSALKSSIRRGLMLLPGNVILMKAAQSERKYQIGFGVKSSVGQRPYMEDSHIMKPFFFRFPISLACGQQLIPNFVKAELEKVPWDATIDGGCSWNAFKTEMTYPKDGSVPCVFDEFDLFLICDGHGGAQVAQYCTANFKKILKKQLNASVEERYVELLQSAQKSKNETEGVEPQSYQENLPERSSKSAANMGDTRARFLDRDTRRFRVSESVRIRGSCNLDSQENNDIARTTSGLPGAQCGLDVHHLHDCLSQSFQELDDEVKDQKLGDFEGSTALAALVGSWHICIANCGDSRAVLSRNSVAVRLTRDHKPHIEEERRRIEKQGGFVLNAYGCSRVNGFLAMSRAIGDHLIPSVIAQPDVTILHRHPLDEFLICATDGLWDVMTDDEACDMTRKCLARAEAKGARKLSTRVAANVLLKAALERGSTDNITIAVVDLRTPQDAKTASRDSK